MKHISLNLKVANYTKDWHMTKSTCHQAQLLSSKTFFSILKFQWNTRDV
jgi:hypothetical protein